MLSLKFISSTQSPSACELTLQTNSEATSDIESIHSSLLEYDFKTLATSLFIIDGVSLSFKVSLSKNLL